ncbi:MAG: hypothetical protein PHY15_02710 [Eubacteriales bacterium]|nr:hypothetical protein [Eubacteriales bacterium]MDD4474889.1 hypothetical protein [Eubacteriales bacterium]
MKLNLKRTIKILVLAIMLLGIVMSLGITSLSKTTLMTDEKLTHLYARVNDPTQCEVTNKNLPNRIAIIDGVEYDLKYRQSFVFDESVYESKTLSVTHSFYNDGVYVTYPDNKSGPDDWLVFTRPEKDEQKKNKTLPVEERIKIALEYASKYINTDGYVLQKRSIRPIIKGYSNDAFVFTKIINGFESNDTFVVAVTKTGYICGFSKQSYGIFNDITVPEIDEELFIKTLNEYAKKIHGEFLYLEIDEERTEIILDKDGNPMIKVSTCIVRAATEEEKKQTGTDKRYIYNANIPVYCDDVKANK